MAILPSPGPALVKLRGMLSQTPGKPMPQITFSNILGLSAGTLSRVEKGAAPLPDSAAIRIEAAFGVSAEGLFEGKLLAMNRAPYEPKHLLQAITASVEAKDFPLVQEDLSFCLDVMLRALGTRGALYGATRLRQAMVDIFDETATEMEYVDNAARVCSRVDAKTMTIAQIAKDDELAGAMAADIKPFKAGQKVKLIIEKYRRWPDSSLSEFRPISAKSYKSLVRATLPDETEKRYVIYSSEVVNAKAAKGSAGLDLEKLSSFSRRH